MKPTKKIAIASIFSALGVVVVWLGSIIEVLDLSAVALASFAIAFAHIELKGYYPYLIYFTTAALLLLVMPIKAATLMYVCFGGVYPTVKLFAERAIKPMCVLIKGCSFLLLMGLGALGMHLIGDPFLSMGGWYLFGLGALAFVTLVLYDYALTVVISFYTFRLRKKIQKYLR